MERKECETRILEKLQEIDKIHKEYNPNANFLSLIINNNLYDFFNEYIEEDLEYPIRYCEFETKQKEYDKYKENNNEKNN